MTAYKLSDNVGLSGYFLSSIKDVCEHLQIELENQEVGETYVFNVEIITMKVEDFNDLPEYQF